MAKTGESRRASDIMLAGEVICIDGATLGDRYDVEVVWLDAGKELARAPCDGTGRFVVRVDEAAIQRGQAIELRARHLASGTVRGRARTVVRSATSEPVQITVDAPRQPARRAERARTGHLNRRRGRREVVTMAWRGAIGKLLGRRFRDRAGRAVVPAWVDAAIRDLAVAANHVGPVLKGDAKHAALFLDLIGNARATGRPRAGGAAAMGLGGAPGAAPSAGSGSFAARDLRDGLPCTFYPGPAIEIAAAAFYLDVGRASALEALTQPGAYSQAAAGFLQSHYHDLHDFAQQVHGAHHGEISEDMLLDGMYGEPGVEGGVPLDLPGEPGLGPDGVDWPPAGGRSGGITLWPPDPAGPGRGAPCDLWIDCVDEIVTAATSYQPPQHCPREQIIGGLSPAAVCRGASNVLITLVPKPGESFSGSGLCNAFIQRDLHHRKLLEIESYSGTEIKVRLDEATLSGCIGFRGMGSGSPARPAVIDTCFRLGRISAPAVFDLLTGIRQPLVIQCTGDNRFLVVPPPVLQSLSAVGPSSQSSPTGPASAHIVEEGCTPVTLDWVFDFDNQDSWVDPDEFVRVTVTARGGGFTAANLPPTGSVTVTSDAPQIYDLVAVAQVDGAACGQATGEITVDRFDALHIDAPAALQTGQSGSLEVRRSCPAPTGGVTVTLSVSHTNRLALPETIEIPAGEDRAEVQISALGSGCTEVTVTATAPGHVQAQVVVQVYDTPQIASLTPLSVPACQAFTLEIQGSCFAPEQTTVRASRPGTNPRTLDIEQISSGFIRATGANLEPGSWAVSVTSRGLTSASQSIEAVATAPVINLFLALVSAHLYDSDGDGDAELHFANEFAPCVTNAIDLAWDVENATRVVVKRGTTVLEDIALPACGGDAVGDMADLISEPATYRLEAHRVGGGAPLIEQIAIGGAGAIRRARIRNQSGRTYVVWKIDGVYQNAADIPHDSEKHEVAHGGEVTLQLADCRLFDIVAIDKLDAENDGYDPEGDAIEIAHLREEQIVLLGKTNGEELEITWF